MQYEGMTMGSDLLHLADLTLGEMLERSAARWPQRPAVAWRDHVITYAQLVERCRRFAAGVAELRLPRGATVGQLCAKRPEVVESFLGTAMAAGRLLPLNPKVRPDDLAELAGLTETRLVLADAGHLEIARDVARRVGSIAIVVVGDADAAPGEIRYADLLRAAPAPPPSPAVRPDEIVYLNSTTGTTGVPKVCPTSHRVIQWNTIASITTLGVTDRDTYLGGFAVYSHPHELFIRSLPIGGLTVLEEGLRPRRLVETLARRRVRAAMGVPSFWRLVASVLRDTGTKLPDLCLLESGGGAATQGLIDDVHAAVGRHPTPVWGSTETCGIALATPPGNVPRAGVLGRPVEHYQVDVFDDARRPLPTGEVGQMGISGPGVCDGYLAELDSTESAEAFEGGRFYSGDLVSKQPDGTILFVGRRKNMLKMAGLRVYPEKIERVLEAHEGVAEAAVVPGPSERHGQVPVAFVVSRAGARLSRQDIVHACRAGLAEFEVPRRIEFVTALPKLGAGKLDRRALIEEAKSLAANGRGD